MGVIAHPTSCVQTIWVTFWTLVETFLICSPTSGLRTSCAVFLRIDKSQLWKEWISMERFYVFLKLLQRGKWTFWIDVLSSGKFTSSAAAEPAVITARWRQRMCVIQAGVQAACTSEQPRTRGCWKATGQHFAEGQWGSKLSAFDKLRNAAGPCVAPVLFKLLLRDVANLPQNALKAHCLWGVFSRQNLSLVKYTWFSFSGLCNIAKGRFLAHIFIW